MSNLVGLAMILILGESVLIQQSGRANDFSVLCIFRDVTG
jgi:hypothetical protein